ncbi:Hypothetical protein RADP37_05297 [Roseomonas mucosa]|uniref:Uncharacterized protein n=1 Tax=Roseomonas mucosa TaxID=207340 RepID=A0A4Y1MVG9_9PROT|nr:hypothetical protein [Roseomonas mucosa]AWV21710.1 Hypothetical protein RADP37_05297 [Roseomonas mucosa]MDT8276698.1 hypothetical protein [Roseomonas mucosa]MDT8355254.1 hypothetical protein [Roseomonas mucosa]
MATKQIGIRLSLEDADLVRRGLQAIGTEGEAALKRIDTSAASMGRAANDASGGVVNLRSAIGQAGFQVQDFAVQVQGGTSALTALSQQGAQLLGVFGPTGAIAGAVLTVGLLATQIISAATSGKDLDGVLKDVEASTKALNAAVQTRLNSLDAEAKRIQDLTTYYRTLNEVQLAGERVSLARQQKALAGKQDDLFGDLGSALSGYRATASRLMMADPNSSIPVGDLSSSNAAIEQAQRVFDGLKDAANQTREGIYGVIGQLSDLAKTADASSRPAIEALINALLDNEDKLLRNGEAARSLSERQKLIEQASGGAAQGVTAVGNAASGATGQVSGMASATSLLASRLADLQAAANQTASAPSAALASAQRILNITTTQGNKAADLAVQSERAANSLDQRVQAQLSAEVTARARVIDAQAAQLNLEGKQDEAITLRNSKEAQLAQLRAEREGAIRSEYQETDKVNQEIARRRQQNTDAETAANKAAAQSRRDAAAATRTAREELAASLRVYSELRLDGASGLLLGNDSDATALKAIQKATKGSILDPDVQKKNQETTRKALEKQQLEADKATDSIVDYAGDRFADLFSSNSKGWSGMLETFEQTAKSTMARIAAELILRPIIAPVVSSLMGSTGTAGISGSSMFSGLTSSLGLSGAGGQISSALGLNGIGSTVSGWLSTPLMTAEAYGPFSAAAPTAAFQGTTLSAGSLLGGAGLGFGAGSVLNTLARGNSTGGTVGSAAGGLAGAAIGSIVPGVGTVLGGLIGGAGGGLLGGLFGGGKGFSGGTIQVEVQDGQLVVAGTRSKGKADSSEAVAALQQQVTTLNTALSQRGLHLNASGLVTEQGFGQDKRAADVSGVARSYLASDDPTIQTVIRNSLGSSLEAVLSDVDWAKSVYQPMVNAAQTSAVDASEFISNLRAQTDPLNAAIDKARELGLATDDLAASLQKTTDAAYAARDATVSDIRNNLMQRSNTALGRNSLQDQIWSANVAGDTQVRQLESQLQSLGYTPGDANGRYAEVNQLLGVLAQETAALTRQYEQQRAANDNGLWDRIQSASGAGNTLEGALWDYNRKATQEWLTATTDGMTDLTLLAKAQSEERLQIERNYAEQAAELARQEAEKAEALRQETLQSELSALQTLSSQSKVLTGWLDSQKLTSSLNSPSSALAEAQRQFSTALDAARTAGPGDADLSAVTSAASSVISAGSAYYGTSSGQAAIETMVRQSINSLGAQLDLPAFTDDVVGAVARLQAAQETGTATLAAKLDAIYAELRTQRLQRAA